VISADINGDGIPDLITANCYSSDVSVLLANGDGTFLPAKTYPASHFCQWVVAGDFYGRHYANGKPILDLVTGGNLDNDISILQGNGDGTFQAPAPVANEATRGPAALVGDFTGDGHLDLAIANTGANAVSLLLGRGHGTFQDPVNIPVGSRPVGLVAGDLGNGHLDLAVTDSGSKDVSVLLGGGDGTFAPPVRYPVGVAPDSIIAGDFTGDGHLDLAVTNGGSTYVSLLRGRGDGTFEPQLQSAVTDTPTIHDGLAVGDFDRDGHLDLATAQLGTSDISVLLGKGDGTFQLPLRFAVGLGPVAAVSGDFSNSGRRDVASVNATTNEVAVALGAGDGTLGSPLFYPVGVGPVAIVTGDFNGDGRLDLAIVNFASNDVSVLLGLGDGTFRSEQRYAVGTNPTGIVAGDFDGDGTLDLAVTNSGSNDISLLFGRGDGTFQPQVRLAAPDLPQALVAGDFGNGHLDLATANYRSQDVTVFLGDGHGTFPATVSYALGTAPVALIAADFAGDGHLDLATANFRSNDVSVLLGRGDGTFQAPVRYEAGSNPLAVVAGDFNGDGHLDLATADSTANAVAFLFGRGNGTFAPPVQRPVAAYPRALVGGDFNNDGRTDLAVATQFSRDVSVLVGLGDPSGTFLSPDRISNEIHATPLVADLNGDGTKDVAVINRAGEILLRYGRPDTPGTFDPPVVLNPDPRFAVRDLALVRTSHGLVLAALDARDPALSFYARDPDGTFTRTPGPTIPGILLPVRLSSGDLNGVGRDDLVVATTGTNQVFVYLQHEVGGFGPTPDYQSGVGVNPSAVSLADVDGDGRLDIVVTNQFSGDVSVLLNDPAKPFCSELRFRAGIGLYWVDQRDGSPVIHSFQGSAGVVVGRFDEDGATDLVVANSGSNSFSLLQGTGLGGLLNPQAAQTFSTDVRPTAVIAGDFNHDGHLDLAILNEGSQDISIFLGDGHGGFTRASTVSAGNLPTGLAVADVNGDGNLDLLVGNDFGDLLVLLGKGDGTFQPYRRAGRNVALAVADLRGNGQADFVFADEALDQVSVSYGGAPPAVFQDRHNGLLAPSAVQLADLNGDGIPDLIVANGGGNNVLVYPGLPGGGFGPEINGGKGFFVGTNPVGITVQDLNGDGLPDLVVANQGSNDVSVLLGERRPDGSWTLTPGPRLDAHGVGPDSAAVRFVPNPQGGPALPQILVANGGSNNVVEVPGVGNGFFDDRAGSVRTFPTGVDPRQVLVGRFRDPNEEDFLTVNAGSNDLTFFSDFGPGREIPTGGDRPVAAVAGDFRHDGLSDLVVVNNGDGVASLLLGGPDGPDLGETITLPGLLHPTDVALSPIAEDRPTFYVTEEGEEQATPFVLTFLGIPVPGGPGAGPPPPPAVPNPEFTLLGPGFPGGLNIPSVGFGEPGDRGGMGTEAPGPFLGEVLVALVGGPLPAGPPEAGASGIPRGGDGGDAEVPPGPEVPASDDDDLPRFLMRLPEALRAVAPGSGQDRMGAIDAVFGGLLSSLARGMADDVRPAVTAGQGALREVAGAAWTALGLLPGTLGAPAVTWRESVDALMEAGLSGVSALGGAARRLLGGKSGPPAPARPGADEGGRPPAGVADPPEAPPPTGRRDAFPGGARTPPPFSGSAEDKRLVLTAHLAAALLAAGACEARRAGGGSADRAGAPRWRGRHAADLPFPRT
jgi:hypothetical protein